MALTGHGTALWEPSPIRACYDRVLIGDVGYIRRGQFNLLFHATDPLGTRVLGQDVPDGYEPLDYGLALPSQPRLPRPLCTRSVVNRGASFGVGTSVASVVDAGASFHFELASDQGAILLTKYRTYRCDAQLDGNCRRYTRKHHASWVRFAIDKGHGDDVSPILVTGTDLTLDFAMLAYASLDRQLSVGFQAAAIGAPVTAHGSIWGEWVHSGSVHHTCGPQLSALPAVEDIATAFSDPNDSYRPNAFDQCVFVRGYRVYKRLGVFPKTLRLRAAADPDDLSKYYDGQADASADAVALDDIEEDGSGFEYVLEHDTPAEVDPLDCIAKYIFENTDAETAVVHDYDCRALLDMNPFSGQVISSLEDLVTTIKPGIDVTASC
ncbi:hypothetical protein PLICRDRAFT_465825 [Plicaturopsis crispa FD-325 SS-3]|nr:hypothetical protein PLICRDRAFT_465825 [Plicaturopsis crispa FD-325 SS-3]